jgi:hypothetical protein
MLIKGIKKGKTIELSEEIDFPDNQEVLEEVFDLVKKRRIEKRRSEIAENGRKILEAMEKGTAQRGNVEKIKSYLLSNRDG